MAVCIILEGKHYASDTGEIVTRWRQRCETDIEPGVACAGVDSNGFGIKKEIVFDSKGLITLVLALC